MYVEFNFFFLASSLLFYFVYMPDTAYSIIQVLPNYCGSKCHKYSSLTLLQYWC